MIAIEEEFEWIGTTVRSNPGNTVSTHEDEIDKRAFLLAKLGVPRKEAEARLKAKLAWEFERVGKAKVTKRVAALVTAAYKRAGLGKKKR